MYKATLGIKIIVYVYITRNYSNKNYIVLLLKF